ETIQTDQGEGGDHPEYSDLQEQLKTKRNELLMTAQQRWRPIAKGRVPFSWVHTAAGVDHKDAYDWKNGKLPDKSVMTTSIERVLLSSSPPKAQKRERG